MPKKMKAKLTLVDQLLEAISKVDRSGTVCTGGDLPLVMPGLEVDGLGTVGLPLGKTQSWPNSAVKRPTARARKRSSIQTCDAPGSSIPNSFN